VRDTEVLQRGGCDKRGNHARAKVVKAWLNLSGENVFEFVERFALLFDCDL